MVFFKISHSNRKSILKPLLCRVWHIRKIQQHSDSCEILLCYIFMLSFIYSKAFSFLSDSRNGHCPEGPVFWRWHEARVYCEHRQQGFSADQNRDCGFIQRVRQVNHHHVPCWVEKLSCLFIDFILALFFFFTFSHSYWLLLMFSEKL